MTWIALPAGVVIVAVVVVDVVLTTLHPSGSGPVSAATRRLTWRALARAAPLRRRGPLLGLAGPVTVAANILAWIAGLWIGFALVYLPYVDTLAYTPSVSFGDPGIFEALYLSGTALTTVGFGDVVASTDGLRLVTTLESASGFGAITAAVSYVLSLYPMLARTRSAADAAAQLGLGSPRGAAAALASAQGLQHAVTLHRDVVAAHHAVRRFPALFYFVAKEERESIVALVTAAATVCAVLRWGIDRCCGRDADATGRALHAALSTLIDDYQSTFRRALADPGQQPPSASDALARLRAHVAGVDASTAASSDEPSDGFAEYLARMQSFVDALADTYGYRPPRLLDG